MKIVDAIKLLRENGFKVSRLRHYKKSPEIDELFYYGGCNGRIRNEKAIAEERRNWHTNEEYRKKRLRQRREYRIKHIEQDRAYQSAYRRDHREELNEKISIHARNRKQTINLFQFLSVKQILNQNEQNSTTPEPKQP
jgi:hypothetical protein